MASKNKSEGSGRRSKTPGQTSASNPDPTATSPSVSSPTGDATTTSLVPSSVSQIITTQPYPPPPPLPVQETQQEFISSTSDGSTTTGLAGPSTSPSAFITDELRNLFTPPVARAVTALERAMEDKQAHQDMVPALFGLHHDDMELVLGFLLMVDEEAIKLTEELLAKRKKRHGSGGSCGGSKGGGGGPDSGSGEGDGEGGGVCA